MLTRISPHTFHQCRKGRHQGDNLPKAPGILRVTAEIPLVGYAQGNDHVQVDGVLQHGQQHDTRSKSLERWHYEPHGRVEPVVIFLVALGHEGRLKLAAADEGTETPKAGDANVYDVI